MIRPKILVGFDYDPPSRAALSEAVRLAKAAHAELVVFHAFGPEPIPITNNVPLVLERKAVADLLACDASYARSLGVETRVETSDGDVAEELLRAIAREAPELVVLGTHGRTGFERLVLGSVARKVLRDSTRPVLIVRPPALPEHSTETMHRIVVGIDFQPASMRALEDATWLARLSQAPLVLVHAVPPGTVMDPDPSRRPGVKLETLAREIQTRDVECTPIISVAEPATALIAESEGLSTTLIAVGTRNRSVAARRLFGSVAEGVLKRSRCPVLVAHANEISLAATG